MKNVYIIMAVALMGMTACGSGRNNKKAEEKQAPVETTQTRAIPADCKTEEGFIWSEVEQNCIRLFERGTSFLSVENPDMSHVAYAVFSADSSKVELIIPDVERREILDRRTTPTGSAWNVEDDDTKNVRKVDGQWVIEQRGKVIYKHTANLGPIEARFQGSDGITRRLYYVDAVFYPEANKAILKLDDKTYELTQYVTASGYGYKNADVDLRGKGKDATLNFTDDQIRDLTLIDITNQE